MINLLVERAFAEWLAMILSPDHGLIQITVGDSMRTVEIRLGVDDRPLPSPVILVDATAEAWAQTPVNLRNWEGVCAVSLSYPVDSMDGVSYPATDALALAKRLAQALLRPDLLEQLTDASKGELQFLGQPAPMESTTTIESRKWLHAWSLPLYVIENQSEREGENL